MVGIIYIIRASFSQERMTSHRETGQVEYKSKDGVQTKVFEALDWLAAMCSHVPIICFKCQGQMRVIAFIHDEDVIRKILKHLNLWDVKHKIPPRAHAPPIDFHNTYNESPMPSVDDQLIDIEYPIEAYF